MVRAERNARRGRVLLAGSSEYSKTGFGDAAMKSSRLNWSARRSNEAERRERRDRSSAKKWPARTRRFEMRDTNRFFIRELPRRFWAVVPRAGINKFLYFNLLQACLDTQKLCPITDAIVRPCPTVLKATAMGNKLRLRLRTGGRAT